MLKYYNHIFKNLKQISINNKHSFVHKVFTNTKIKRIQHLLVLLFFSPFCPSMCIQYGSASQIAPFQMVSPNSPKMNSEFERIDLKNRSILKQFFTFSVSSCCLLDIFSDINASMPLVLLNFGSVGSILNR